MIPKSKLTFRRRQRLLTLLFLYTVRATSDQCQLAFYQIQQTVPMLNESWIPKSKLTFRRRQRLLTLLFHYTVRATSDQCQLALYQIQQTVSMLNELIESWTPKYQLAFLSSMNKRKYRETM